MRAAGHGALGVLGAMAASGFAATTSSATPTPLLGSARSALRYNGSDLVILRPVCDGIVAVRLPCGVGIGWARAGIVTVRLPCGVGIGWARAGGCRRGRGFVGAATKGIRVAVEVCGKAEPPIELEADFLRSSVDVAVGSGDLPDDPAQMQLGSRGQGLSSGKDGLGERGMVPSCRLTKGIHKQRGRDRRGVTERVACLAPPRLTALVTIPSLSGMRGQGAARCVQERDVQPGVGGGARVPCGRADVVPRPVRRREIAGGRMGAAGRRGGCPGERTRLPPTGAAKVSGLSRGVKLPAPQPVAVGTGCACVGGDFRLLPSQALGNNAGRPTTGATPGCRLHRGRRWATTACSGVGVRRSRRPRHRPARLRLGGSTARAHAGVAGVRGHRWT